jgi:endoglucanase
MQASPYHYSRTRIVGGLIALTVLLLSDYAYAQKPAPLPYTGTNLSGAEFGNIKPGVTPIFGKDYTYPTDTEFAYFAAKGMNIIRLPFHWEALQPKLRSAFVAEEQKRLVDTVHAATARGLTVIVDPHNFARYYGDLIGSPKVSAADFADLWRRLAPLFKNDPLVWFGLVNEPHDMPTPDWFTAADAAVAAIRKTGAKNLILIPGNGWDGAHSWEQSGNGILLRIKDPANYSVFEAHQYLDHDFSGSHPEVMSATVGSERLKTFTDWCRRNHKKAFLGEFGAPASDLAHAAVDEMLTYMEKNRDVWTGFTWWSAGPWWGNYMFSLEPNGRKDSPQLAYLQPHLYGKPRSHQR